MKMDIILSKWCLAILFAFGILACTDGGDANELPKEPEGTGETQDEKIPAFPGAEGHGRYTTGGRGGDVYIVTSLEDKLQNGTLRYGIEKLSGKRTIIFQVSGTIHLNGDLKIKNGDLTIAGQTAPGDGICLAGYPVFLEADNVIVRFMRFRMGNKEDVSADGADAFGGRYHRNIMIDPGRLYAESWLKQQGITLQQITDEHREEFAGVVAERYYKVVSEAIRKYDPNHLYLGSRLHGKPKFIRQIVEAAGRYCDVVAINYYGAWTPSEKTMKHWGEWAQKPFIITEFYTKGMDSGLANTTGAGFTVQTQQERGYAYQHFVLGL